MATRLDRLRQNEVLFRELNERLRALRHAHEPDPWSGRADYLCECADAGCLELIELALDEYDGARSNGGVFLVYPGHEGPDSGSVIERNDRFLLVERADYVHDTDRSVQERAAVTPLVAKQTRRY